MRLFLIAYLIAAIQRGVYLVDRWEGLSVQTALGIIQGVSGTAHPADGRLIAR